MSHCRLIRTPPVHEWGVYMISPFQFTLIQVCFVSSPSIQFNSFSWFFHFLRSWHFHSAQYNSRTQLNLPGWGIFHLLLLLLFLLHLPPHLSPQPAPRLSNVEEVIFSGDFPRGPKSLNFPDGNFQRAKTFRMKCVNCFRKKKRVNRVPDKKV